MWQRGDGTAFRAHKACMALIGCLMRGQKMKCFERTFVVESIMIGYSDMSELALWST